MRLGKVPSSESNTVQRCRGLRRSLRVCSDVSGLSTSVDFSDTRCGRAELFACL